MPFLIRVRLTTATTLSTSRNRFRWRRFWGGESRQGVFLLRAFVSILPPRWLEEGGGFAAYQSSPPERAAVGLKAPNIATGKA